MEVHDFQTEQQQAKNINEKEKQLICDTEKTADTAKILLFFFILKKITL